MKKYFDYFRVSLKVSIKNTLRFRADLIFTFLETFLILFTLFAFWTALYAERTEVSGIDKNTMLFYTLSSILLGIFVSFDIEQKIVVEIRRGTISLSYIRPIAYPLALFFDAVAQTIVKILFQILPYIIIAFQFFSLTGSVSIRIGIVPFISLCLSFLIFIVYQLIFGFLAFWTQEISGVLALRSHVIAFFSGSLVPLWFFPEWLFNVSKYLPFQAMYHTPLSLLIGKIPSNESAAAIAVQGLWLAVFILVFLPVYKRAVKRIIVHGG